jgi:hypothetical protein
MNVAHRCFTATETAKCVFFLAFGSFHKTFIKLFPVFSYIGPARKQVRRITHVADREQGNG